MTGNHAIHTKNWITHCEASAESRSRPDGGHEAKRQPRREAQQKASVSAERRTQGGEAGRGRSASRGQDGAGDNAEE